MNARLGALARGSEALAGEDMPDEGPGLFAISGLFPRGSELLLAMGVAEKF